MLTKHNGHSCVTVKSIFDDARNSVESSIGVCQDREEGLVNAMKSVRNAMYKINEEREVRYFMLFNYFIFFILLFVKVCRKRVENSF